MISVTVTLHCKDATPGSAEETRTNTSWHHLPAVSSGDYSEGTDNPSFSKQADFQASLKTRQLHNRPSALLGGTPRIVSYYFIKPPSPSLPTTRSRPKICFRFWFRVKGFTVLEISHLYLVSIKSSCLKVAVLPNLLYFQNWRWDATPRKKFANQREVKLR